MPFVHWIVDPKYVSRKQLDVNENDEFETVSNNSLVAVLQQLACVVKCANRIFDQVGQDLNNINNRSINLTRRIKKLNENVAKLDAKKVPIPVGDLTKFSLVKQHYVASQSVENGFFERENRPLSVRLWYDAANLSPVHIMRQIDKFRQDGCRSSKYFICMPVFKDDDRFKVDLEIETRRPASMCTIRNWQNEDLESSDEIDNSLLRLPSPEERTHALSLKYQYSDVPIDVTGNSFRRMGSLRRSFLQQVEFFTRKKKKKKLKSNRRNTISGGDEIEAALMKDYDKKVESSMSKLKKRFSIAEGARFFRENGFDHFYNSLRRPAENKSVQTGEDDSEDISIVKNRLYETLNPKKKDDKKKNSKSNIPISTYSQAMSLAVKLRGQRSNSSRTSGAKGEDSGQSSSGNWSASSSTRTSVESGNLKTAALEFVTTSSQASLSKDSALSEGTTQNESNDSHSDNSTSTNTSTKMRAQNSTKNFSAKDTEHWLRGLREELPTSEDGTSTTGTLTPLLGNRALSPMLFIDDEDSSVYSVDTDGYYTSMHTDSGLRSLSSSSKPVDGIDKDGSDENGSTMSSISTIDQTDSGETKSDETSGSPQRQKSKKIAPMPPRRSSSLRTPSETSDTTRPSPSTSPESDDRSSLKTKTVINASRIPSMCIVTPNPSDDEASSNCGSLERSDDHNCLRSILNVAKPEKNDKKKKISWSEGNHTLPRSFARTYSGGSYDTNSWPRTLSSRNSPKTNISTTELSNESVEPVQSPRLPLKYVQHITVTPGKRIAQEKSDNSPVSTPVETPKPDSTGTGIREPAKVIYATNSLERKNNSIYDRPKAHVAFDPRGHIVAVPKVHRSNPRENELDRTRYGTDTLPRARLTQHGPPVPLFPSTKTPELQRDSFRYSSLPRNHREIRGPSPPSPGDSSPRDSMADLPPPMSLMSPTLSQTARRWTYGTSGDTLRTPHESTNRPSFLPIARPGIRPPTPLYRPPPAPNVRPPSHGATWTRYTPPYQLIPRTGPPQTDRLAPTANGRVVSGSPTNAPPTPQRQYVLNVARGQEPRNLKCQLTSENIRNNSSVNEIHCENVPDHHQSFDSLKRITKPSMTTDDLFAAIHQSKKRLNLKTPSDRSVSPSSVRSESPSLFGGRIPRISSPESGTLSPRRCLSPGGRKSWSGDCPSPGPNSPNDRRTWAMDRLGNNKPTTMKDFKMLLLAAGRNNCPQTVQRRPSATEMLKVTPPPTPTNKSPPRPSPQPAPQHRSSPLNGHLGIPIIDATTPPQRVSPRVNHSMYGRGRSRYPFHPRTDILSTPIWEDNTEDLESPTTEENYFAINGTPKMNGFGINNAKRALY